MQTHTRPTMPPLGAARPASPLVVRQPDDGRSAGVPVSAAPTLPLTWYLRHFVLPASLKLWQHATDNLCHLIRMQATIHTAARESGHHFVLFANGVWQLSLSRPGSARWRAALRESRQAPAPAESPT